MFLTFRQHIQLLGDLFQPSQHHFIAIHKSENRVPNAYLFAKLSHKFLSTSEIVPRHSGEQVVNGLELQAPMNEVQPCRAIYIHCSTQLLLCERFRSSEVCRRHTPVGEGDLYVERHGRYMADQNERDTERPGWYGRPDEAIPE